MSFDSLVANAGRLQILTSLAVDERQEFVQLRHATQLTDGNLASHARRLKAGGLIAIDKEFRDGKPVTQFTLTVDGRKALEAHTRRLIAAISHRRLAPATNSSDDVAKTAPVRVPARKDLQLARSSVIAQAETVEEDWID
jgi:DNA-binding MarR family transcriptional regulator